MSIAESLWTSRICLCSHNQVFFFIFGITNEAVVNDAVLNPSQMNAYVRIQLLSHTDTCIIPENPITVWHRCCIFCRWQSDNCVWRWKVAFRTCNDLVERRWLGWDLRLAPDLETEGSHWMHVSSRHQHGHASPISCYSRNHDTRFILSTLLTHRNNHLMESSSHVVLTRMMMSESVIYGLVNSWQARYNARRLQNLQHLHWPCVCSVLGPRMAHGDGTKLASDHCNDPIKIYNLIRIYDIADHAAKHQNVTHGYVVILWGTRDGWLIVQNDLSAGKLYV